MKFLTPILMFLIFSFQIAAQVHINKPEHYYDKFHFGRAEKIYTYHEDYQSYEIDTALLFNSYLDFAILNMDQNMRYLYQDENGVFLPYDQQDLEDAKGFYGRMEYNNFSQNPLNLVIYRPTNDEGKIINTSKSKRAASFFAQGYEEFADLYEFEILSDTIPWSLLDTIHITRSPPIDYALLDEYDKWEERDDRSEYFQHIRLITLDKSNPLWERYAELLVDVQVELEERDLYSKNKIPLREVVNPHRITNKMIQRLSISLQELGYLTTGASRYVPEIRDAIYGLQLDHNIPTGFLDEKTFEILGLEFIDRHCKCVKEQILCSPASLERHYGKKVKDKPKVILNSSKRNNTKRRYK